ncbi:TetR/AcrR family transcriptional regulator [Flavilitoribacter nigricans]|uniref:TetR family transcriptional regulator n=1 Tax=Flavilitoribacter nigricans (strain ATCC 23147 / DSM 23189 / NBRC 102662 / NCIMB 1420 / SS-2) TaxID=1122177 RepID=A0A2D0N5N5_FLAN2|nr:TetR/AcrR family transcriptional regulator [Flavilitoribacter nigricans]PHN03814.1 TetR family transcriptional regulator [Flavilitoribacter nigricans DSM 23189 = NBRC 102662]
MASTKQKILAAALQLFNRDGLVNVRLQHIADEAFVSVGNLAYHYANKEAIVLAIYETLAQRQEALLTEYRIVPLFDNIDRLIRLSFHLQQDYIFFYLDTLEISRAYPAVAAAHRQHIVPQIGQLRAMLDFNAARGALVSEPVSGAFDQLSEQLWMTMDFWRYQRAVRAEDYNNEPAYRQAVWALLLPYFTAMGKLEYQQMLEHPYDFYF